MKNKEMIKKYLKHFFQIKCLLFFYVGPLTLLGYIFFQDGGALIWLPEYNKDKYSIEHGLGSNVIFIALSIFLTYFYIRMCFIENNENKFPYD